MKRIFRYYTLLLLAVFVSLAGTGCAPSNKMGTSNNQSNLRGTQITRNTPNAPNTRNNQMNQTNRNAGNNQMGQTTPNAGTNQMGQTTQNARNNQMGQTTPNQDFRIADHVVKKVANLKEVKTASAVVKGNKAYIAVTMKGKKENAKLERSIEKKIIKNAKSADPNLKHVYVSTHPDFVQQLNNYTNNIRNGHPIKHLTNGLQNTIQRVFPIAR